MKKYEKDLKKLIDISHSGCKPVHQDTSGMCEEQLRFISAKGLVSLLPAGDNKFVVILEPAGLAYFSNKSEKLEDFIKEHIASFLSGFVSGVLATVSATWIIQTVL